MVYIHMYYVCIYIYNWGELSQVSDHLVTVTSWNLDIFIVGNKLHDGEVGEHNSNDSMTMLVWLPGGFANWKFILFNG